MGMFLVPEGTIVKGIKDGVKWRKQNFVQKPLQKALVFGKEQLTVDPTGIASYAVTPTSKELGSGFAKAGYYGFKFEGWTIFVHKSKVQYG